MMKNLYLYVILILFEIAVALTYGFILQNIISTETCLSIAFLVPFILLVAFSKKDQEKIQVKVLKTLVVALFFALSSSLIFYSVNGLNGELIGEYEVIVENVSGKAGGSAGFISPYGTHQTVELHDYRPIYTDEDDYVAVGDTIKVREFKGIFGRSYYVFVEEIH